MRLEGLQGCVGGGWGQREGEVEEEQGEKKNHRASRENQSGTSEAGGHAVMFSTIRRTFRIGLLLLAETNSVHVIISDVVGEEPIRNI